MTDSVSTSRSDERWIECKFATSAGDVLARFTTTLAGDFAVAPRDGQVDALEKRRAAVCPVPITWMVQTHSADVHTITRPADLVGVYGDALVCSESGVALSVQTADCVPIVAVADSGAFAVIHAGWRGASLGVVEAAISRLKSVSSGRLRAMIGPCISAPYYEFGKADLAAMTGLYGDSVARVTTWGTPSLALAQVARIALERSGVTETIDLDLCTASSDRFYSHRARGDSGRMMLVAWREHQPNRDDVSVAVVRRQT